MIIINHQQKDAFLMTARNIALFTTTLTLIAGCAEEKSEKQHHPTSDADAGVDGGAGETDTAATDDGQMKAHEVFEQSALLEYRFTINESDWTAIEDRGDEEAYYPAALEIAGGDVEESYDTVGFRHKGAWSLHHCFDTGSRSYEDECAKLSYKVKFNEYDSESRLYGLKRINLHAMSGERSKLRERLAYDMFNAFGVVAPRTAYATVYINNTFMGLFLQVEQIDGRFTAFHFPNDGDGNLYKEVWPKVDVPTDSYIEHLKTNNDPEDAIDVSDMRAFAETIEQSNDETFEDDMTAVLDLENLLRYMAVDRASNNWDGIVTFYSPTSPHNFYWYHDADPNGIFHLIPWDLDNTFWPFDPFMDPQDWATADPIPDWNVEPAHCERRPVWEPDSDTMTTPPGCDKLINLLARTCWDRFVDIGETLLDGPMNMDVMLAKIDTWQQQINTVVREDPFINYTDWQDSINELHYALEENIRDFGDHLAEGYRIEPPIESVPEPSEDELNAVIAESGIRADIINNYEFENGASETAPPDVYSYGAEASTHTPAWNTDDPISGNADLRYDFEFVRTAGAWDEWVNLTLGTDSGEVYNLSDLSEISITLRADTSRNVRIRLYSPVYDEQWGGIWSEFGMDFVVTPDPSIVKIQLDHLYYPDWAKDAWESGQGWTGDDGTARDEVINAFGGLLFAPSPTTDSAGEMTAASESGFLQIDNIYFR